MKHVTPACNSERCRRRRRQSTIGRRLAAIRYAHRLAGVVDSPTSSELVRATLRGIRRKLGTAPEQKAPATTDVVGAIAAAPATEP